MRLKETQMTIYKEQEYQNRNRASRNLEKILQVLEQAKQRIVNDKKKQNEKKHTFFHNKVIAGSEKLYLFVKFMPALC